MKHFNMVVVFIAICASVLLFGTVFNLHAFGGGGFVTYPTLTFDGSTWPRGSTYTFDETKSIAPFRGADVIGEKGTVLTFLDTRKEPEGNFSIGLITGRINTTPAFQGPITFHANQLAITVYQSDAELIHYSWKNQLEIIVRTGAVHLDSPTGPANFEAPMHLLLSTDTGEIVPQN